MAASFLQISHHYDGSTSFPFTVGAAGNLLVVWTTCEAYATDPEMVSQYSVIDDSLHNTWTALPVAGTTTGNATSCKAWYAFANAAGDTSVTIVQVGSDWAFSAAEFSGVSNTDTVITVATLGQTSGGTSTATSNALTSATGIDVAMVLYADEFEAPAADLGPSPFVLLQHEDGHYDASGYAVNLPAGTYAPAFELGDPSSSWVVLVVAFCSAAGAVVNIQAVQTVTDTFAAWSDSCVRLGAKNWSDTTTLSDAFSKWTTRLISNSLSLGDSFARAIARNVGEAFQFVEGLSKITTRSVGEAIPFGEGLSKIATRTLGEAIAFGEGFFKITTRSLGEAIALGEGLSKRFSKGLSEIAFVFGETFSTIRGYFFAETLVLGESLRRSSAKLIFETLVVADPLVRSLNRLVSEATVVTDSLLRWSEKVTVDAVAVAESFSRSSQKLLSETISVAESVFRSIGRVISEAAVSVADSFVKFAERKMLDILAVNDQLGRAWSGVVQFIESLVVSDAIAKSIRSTIRDRITAVESVISNFVSSHALVFLDMLVWTETSVSRLFRPMSKITPALSIVQRFLPFTKVTDRTSSPSRPEKPSGSNVLPKNRNRWF